MREAFTDYKSNPTPDTLVRLLRAHQDRVYRVCYHVLRQAHDAEDAAQEALIRIAAGARELADPESFRRWVHRVSLNSALEIARKASRRRTHESRAAMKESPPAPLDAETRCALFEAIAALPDATRSLVLDRYAEGETLESLAGREGVTPQAVSKRLDRAREDLRRALPTSLALAFDWDRLFDAGTFAIPDLVKGAVLKAASGTSLALKLAVGGLLVAAAIGAGVALSPKPETVLELRKPAPEGYRRTNPSSGETSILPKPSGPAPAANPTPPVSGALEARLIRFRTLMAEYRADYDKRRRSEFLGNQSAEFEYVKRMGNERMRHLEGVRDLIAEDPAAFFQFLNDPQNADCIQELCATVFVNFQWMGADDWGIVKLNGETLPAAVIDGFYEILGGGTPAARMAALGFFSSLSRIPASFEPHWTAAIQDPDAAVSQRAVQMVSQVINPAPREVQEAVIRTGRTSPHLEVRREAARAMAWIPGPESQSFLLERMETVKEPYELFDAVLTMTSKFLAASRGGDPVDESRFLQAAMAIAARKIDGGYQKWLVGTAVYVPAARSRAVVERAMASAADAETRTAIANVLKAMDAGETDPAAFNKLLWPAK